MKCYSRGGTVVHRRRLLGIRSIEAFLAAPYPPPAHPVSLQAYPPCYTSQCRDIWSTRPFVRKSIASHTLVAIRHLVNGRSQSPGHHGTTSPLVLSTHHQRPHPHAGPEDSVSPLTRLVSRAWYGIRHLTTPLRSIHLPVESQRKVGALGSPLQLTRPHGWHSGALGSP